MFSVAREQLEPAREPPPSRAEPDFLARKNSEPSRARLVHLPSRAELSSARLVSSPIPHHLCRARLCFASPSFISGELLLSVDPPPQCCSAPPKLTSSSALLQRSSSATPFLPLTAGAIAVDEHLRRRALSIADKPRPTTKPSTSAP